MRDMQTTAAAACIPRGYDITLEEINYLHSLICTGNDENIWDAIMMAFRYGFALGERKEKRRMSGIKKKTASAEVLTESSAV